MSILKETFLSAILGLGLISLIMPIFLYWFIHGNYERYSWIINGPYPFNNFGSGPYQFWMGIAFVVIGFLLIAVSIILRVVFNKN
ncbi:hypothetical protein ACSVDA_01400 [Cytobacillus sp. Hm23]